MKQSLGAFRWGQGAGTDAILGPGHAFPTQCVNVLCSQAEFFLGLRWSGLSDAVALGDGRDGVLGQRLWRQGAIRERALDVEPAPRPRCSSSSIPLSLPASLSIRASACLLSSRCHGALLSL